MGNKSFTVEDLLEKLARIYTLARQSYAGQEAAMEACTHILTVCREVYPPTTVADLRKDDA